MSSVKISQLNLITQLNANTQNTLFVAVDVPSGITGKFTGHTLAQGLYSNEILNVGNNQVTLPNTIAQFSLAGGSYIQTNLVNLDNGGTADIVVTANTGTDSTYFIDMGYANANVTPGLEFNNLGTALYPLDGYIYAQGNGVGNARANGGNLIVGTTSTGTEVKFIAGGYNSGNIVATMTADGFKLVNGHPIYFTDGTTQNTAAASFAYSNVIYGVANVGPIAFTQSNASFIQANAAYAMALAGIGTANSATTLANAAFLQANNEPIGTSAFTRANSAFSKANNALANTTGTFAGDLTLTGNLIAVGIQSTTGAISTGNLIVNGTTSVTGTSALNGIVTMNAQVVMTNGTFSNTQSALRISATANVATPSNDGYMIHISGKQNVTSRIVSDSYGANTYVVYAGRSARGNVTNPTAVQTNDILSRFSGNGYGATGWAQFGSARIDFVAAENYTDAVRGSQIQFWNVPVGSNTLTKIAMFNGDSVQFTGEVNPQKGFVYTPNVISGITTTLNIDIANNSLYRFTTNATTTISLSGYKTGKIVEVWLTNTDTGGGSNHTITHGCLANNSTIGAASFTLTSLHSAYIKYFSIDGDLANTFCQVTYS
jgi:hypothetical protein